MSWPKFELCISGILVRGIARVEMLVVEQEADCETVTIKEMDTFISVC
jgi:hypothetical protein